MLLYLGMWGVLKQECMRILSVIPHVVVDITPERFGAIFGRFASSLDEAPKHSSDDCP